MTHSRLRRSVRFSIDPRPVDRALVSVSSSPDALEINVFVAPNRPVSAREATLILKEFERVKRTYPNDFA